jgi:hypothetical protein
MEQAYGPRLKALAADRGFDNAVSRFAIKAEAIYNAVCPRRPQQLMQRSRAWRFRRLQRRRAQTEGRLSILKNAFLDGQIRSRGFAHRELTVTWAVLVHNLWVMARRQRAEAQAAQRQAA